MHRRSFVGKVVFAFLLLSIITPCSTARVEAASLPKKLDNALYGALVKESRATHTPGVIAGVWEKGKGSWRTVWGVASTTTDRPPVFRDVTRIGSITKTFTTTMILLLVKKHELSLDDTIGRWFPGIPDCNKITIRMLGNMSSGIGNYTDDPTWQKNMLANPQRVWTTQALVRIGLGMPRKFSPGHGFYYSNTNTVMLELIIQDITHEPFARELKKMILQPLGLTCTGYPTTDRLPTPHWQGYTSLDASNTRVDATNWNPSWAAAAGQMTSTLKDLHRWSVALGTGALLTPALQKERLQPNPGVKPANGHAYDFGVAFDNGWIYHNGSLPGFNTVAAYLPADRTSIVVMANTDSESPADKIFKALAVVVASNRAP